MFFNPNDYKNNDQNDDDDNSQYINRNGDQMVGELTVPYIKLISTVNPITFGDATIQKTAFNIDNDIIKDINIDISNIRLDISKFNLDISDINTDISNISYDKVFNKTTIAGLTYINNLSTGNINTSHLSNTTSNLQTEINNLNKNTQYIFVSGDVTYIEKELRIAEKINFSDETSQFTAFSESHHYLLSGATTNLQDQINNISTKSTFKDTPLIINNSSLDDTIAKFGQPDYLELNFHNAITIQPISTDRTFFIGSLSKASDGAVAQFMIGANSGGVPDPDVLMSLSREAVYFFGVKQPLVPVGAIQIFAGSSAPDGYLLCQGQAISKSTYNLLWNEIGNTYLNGRAGGTSNFYLPDLRGVFIRGAGLSTAYSPNVTGGTLGQFQTHSVQDHYHKYSRPNDSITVGGSNSVSSNSVWDNSVAISTTQGGVYDDSGDLLVAETRPANISMNYIIKY